jgi:membrane-associated phospholipid phosphatase
MYEELSPTTDLEHGAERIHRDEREALGAEATARLPMWQRVRLLDFAFCLLLYVSGNLIGRYGTTFCRGFYWNDLDLNRPMLGDTCPTTSLVPIQVLPAGVSVAATFVAPIGVQSPVFEALYLVLLQARAVSLNEIVTNSVKCYAGRLRPDWISRLKSLGYTAPADPSAELFLCNETSPTALDGRHAFPSGHSSDTFSGVTPLTLFFLHRIGAFSRGSIVRFFIACIPMILAFVVAVSRTRDNRHHFADVLAGSCIGFLCSTVAYHLTMMPIPPGALPRWSTFAEYMPRPPVAMSSWRDFRPRSQAAAATPLELTQ